MPRRRASLAVLASLLLPAAAHSDVPVYYGGRWLLTEYWIADERTVTPDRGVRAVRSREGDVLAWTCPRFVSSLEMEGTGRTWDGRLLNWDARVNGRACFVQVDPSSYPYGIGTNGYALVPFRSLAVDRGFIPLGHTVELPEVTGLVMPDGSVHDGCFVAVDGGGAIRGHHIDLFVPTEHAWRSASMAGYLPRHVTQVVVDAARCEHARRYLVSPIPAGPVGFHGL